MSTLPYTQAFPTPALKFSRLGQTQCLVYTGTVWGSDKLELCVSLLRDGQRDQGEFQSGEPLSAKGTAHAENTWPGEVSWDFWIAGTASDSLYMRGRQPLGAKLVLYSGALGSVSGENFKSRETEEASCPL